MILVELDTGSERVFGSLAELAEAIRTGVVGPGSRVYHRTSAQWLPITSHPVFKRTATERLSPPLPPLARTRWTFFDASSHPGSGREDPAQAEGEGRTPGTPANPSPPGPFRRAIGRAMQYLRARPQ